MGNSNGTDPAAAAIAKLSALTRLLYGGFEIAVPEILAWFENRKEKPEPWLSAQWVRYLVKQHLAKHGQDAVEEELRQENIANNGLWLRFGVDQVQIWKAVYGGIPTPGDSKARIAYCSQERLPGLLFDDDERDRAAHNYIIAWDADKNFSFKGLLLALPRSATATSIELAWPVTRIPHPAETIISAAPAEAPILEDLPIGIDRKKTGQR